MHSTQPLTVSSPDGRVRVVVGVADGRPWYSVSRGSRVVVDRSALGFELAGGTRLDAGFEVAGVDRAAVDETWEPVWGASSRVRDHHHELVVRLAQPGEPRARMDVVFRVFDDGVGFRYVFPAQQAFDDLVVVDELTEFRFTGDHTAWSIPANYDSHEYLYAETPLTGIGALAPGDEPQRSIGTEVPHTAATPVTVRVADDLYVALHEAALVDFADMTLTAVGGGPVLRAALTPLKDGGGVKARVSLPARTPWRTVLVGESPGDLVESALVLNLNEPCALRDTSWIRPAKYVGIWWSIHKGQQTRVPGPALGATTENAERYVDFAAANGIPLVLVEGWNAGWGHGETQDFLRPNAQFDLDHVVGYARARGVRLLAHAETRGDVANLERQLDAAFARYEELGIPGVKTGYAGTVADHHHGDQWMVNHYHRVVAKAAEHHLVVDAHEVVKPTGLERTYPNFLTRECVRGLEYEAWSRGNPAEHTTTIPFTRMLAGPLEYTPGIFDVTWQPEQAEGDAFGDANDHTRVHTTRAHQLALYPVLLSGLQMLADVPENYADQPELEFLRHVPTTWDETRVLHAAIGDYVTIARRSGTDWYVGSLTDEHERTLVIGLRFLAPGTYAAHIYGDAPETDYDTNPNAVRIERHLVTSADTLQARLAPSGGHAIRLTPASDADLRTLAPLPG